MIENQRVGGANFKISRGINGCSKVYTSYKSYRKHIIKKHQELMIDNDDIDSKPWPVQVLADDECSDTNVHDMNHSGISHKTSCLLKLKEERRISQRAINGIVSDINTLFEK